jgi:hypothetical protein
MERSGMRWTEQMAEAIPRSNGPIEMIGLSRSAPGAASCGPALIDTDEREAGLGAFRCLYAVDMYTHGYGFESREFIRIDSSFCLLAGTIPTSLQETVYRFAVALKRYTSIGSQPCKRQWNLSPVGFLDFNIPSAF